MTALAPLGRGLPEPAFPADRRLPALLWVLGAVVGTTVVFYSFVHPLAPVRMAVAGAGLIEESPWWSAVAALPWPRLSGGALVAALLGVGAVAFAAYGLAVVATWRRHATRATLLAVVVPAALFSVTGALAMPTQSGDIVDYLLSGRVAAAHGASPYVVAPEAFPDDPLLPFASGDYTTDTERKPPVWIGVAVGVAALAGDAPAIAVLSLRGVFAALNLVNLWLIWSVLRRWRPDHVLAGLVLYGWSPVITTHAQAKFDVVMATFALLAALALVTGRRYTAVATLWSSVLVKLLTLPLLAVYLLGELRARRWRSATLSAAVVVGLTLVLYAPVDGGVRRVVDHLLLTERGGAQLPAPFFALFVLTACGLVLWAGVTSRGETERLLQGWALVVVGLVLLVPPGWSWYFIMPIAVVSLCGERWKTLVLVGLSGLDFALDTWMRSKSSDFPLPTANQLSGPVVYAVLVGAVVLTAGAVLLLRGWARGRVAAG